MRFVLAIFLSIGIFLPLHASPHPEEDKAAIEQAISNWDRAWKIKDPLLASRDYASDADWTNAFGMIRKGQVEIEATLKEVFALPFVMAGESATSGQDVRFLDQNTALVLTRVKRSGQLDPENKNIGNRQTSHLRVFSRRDGRWQIVSHLISDARSTETAKQ